MLTIILPVYNESYLAKRTIQCIEDFFKTSSYRYEIIIIDDGSQDNTYEILARYCHGKEHLKLKSNLKNRGKGFSLRKGIEFSSGTYLFFMDSDLSYSPHQIPFFIEKLDMGFDLVIGSRRHPLSRFILGVQAFPYIYYRHLQGLIFNAYVKCVTGLPVNDTQCGFKAMKRNFAETLVHESTIDGFSFDVEMLIIALKTKAKLTEIPINMYYELENDTKMGGAHKARAVFDILKLTRHHLKKHS